MTRQQLEHIIRASGSITDQRVILVLGSQAILGAVENAPEKLVVSIEADVFPLNDPDKMELINGSIGEISRFHETFGYYAHGIPPDSCPLPAGWEKRLISIKNENTNGVTGLCLSALDLTCTKLAAGRPKDLDFVTEIVARQGLEDLIKAFAREDYRAAARRSLQIVEHRLKFLEIADFDEPGARGTSHGKAKDRDELSL